MFNIEKLNAQEVPPHLGPLRYILDQSQRKKAGVGKVKVALDIIPHLKLKPEHAAELADGLKYVSGMAKQRKEKYSSYIAGMITRAQKDLLKHHSPAIAAATAGFDSSALKTDQAFNAAVAARDATGLDTSGINGGGILEQHARTEESLKGTVAEHSVGA